MKFISSIVLSVLFINASVSGQVYEDERISNGQTTKEGDFPFIVSLTVNGEHICGGFIYNQRFVVTSATCVKNLTPADLTVVVGQHSLIFADPYERRLQVIGITPHESYDDATKLNNLAVIETSQSITFTAGHVEVIYYNEVNVTYSDATIIGWGATQDNGLPSVELLKAAVTISDECTVYGSDEYVANYMVCAGSPTSSPCVWDEGSPLIQGANVVGIVSNNRGCTSPFLPTLYTRLSAYYAWINRYAGLQPPKPTTAPASDLFQF